MTKLTGLDLFVHGGTTIYLSVFYQGIRMQVHARVHFSGRMRVSTGLRMKKSAKRVLITCLETAAVAIMKNMTGLDLFVRDGSTTNYLSVFCQEDLLQDFVKVHFSGGMRVSTGLKMKKSVKRVFITCLETAAVAIMKNMTGLDLFVRDGSTTIYHFVFYQEDLLQDFAKVQSDGGMRVSTGLKMKRYVKKFVLIHQN